MDIRKAVAEGRKPVPGPPVSETDVPDGEVDMDWGTEVFFLVSTKLCCFCEVSSRFSALFEFVNICRLIYLHEGRGTGVKCVD